MPPSPRLATLWLLAGSSHASPAFALGPNGAPIDTSDYTIDLHDGPILSNSRITGLAGAYAPLIEGVAGYAVNPASVAARVPWSKSWVDWELDGSFTLPSAVVQTDFDNNGDDGFANNAAAFAMVGGGIQFGYWGLGLRVALEDYDLESRALDGPSDLTLRFLRADIVLGHGFYDGQLLIGAGVGIDGIELTPPALPDGGEAPPVASLEGLNVQLGAIWAPHALPLRLGAAARFPIADEDAVPEGAEADDSGNFLAEGYYFPRRIEAPAELHAALAVQLWRPLNVAWDNPRRRVYATPETAAELPPERSARERRSKLLISTAVKVTLPTRDGVGVESFFSQRVERSGRLTTISPSLGIESEPLPGWFVVRAGSYLEPTRFSGSRERLHGTAGLDIHIPVFWSVFGLFDDDTTFRVGGAIDGAARYFGWGLSLGVWR